MDLLDHAQCSNPRVFEIEASMMMRDELGHQLFQIGGLLENWAVTYWSEEIVLRKMLYSAAGRLLLAMYSEICESPCHTVICL
ncbi:hypothetical protein [Actinotignum schaalii]|uniref:hypothetical protein n=1 Tax=Actinotignum schaalii TaxID=59505 RepID=UPI00040E8821|nr:hypothetical protein [Actinotignum schaalii]AIE83154.1 hypothetical protein FB03_07750 [Actinotignum schaalii]WQN45334.1 hypothetical protein U4A90_01155 [Actinotignum schaalii]